MNTDKLSEHEILGFEQYVKSRKALRPGMIAIRKLRSVSLTEHIRLVFENKKTVIYQIQEVLYAARSSDGQAICAEIETYQHLLPGNSSLTATLLLEYEDAADAELALNYFNGIEKTVFLDVAGHGKVWPRCNDDLDGRDIISPVHYLKFELSQVMIQALVAGASLRVGIGHYRLPIAPVTLREDTRRSLLADLKL